MNNSSTDNFLHTTHRTSAWFKKSFLGGELDLAPPYQRNAVWTDKQKSYLIDTVLQGLPIPELYMQDVVNEEGAERHIVVDGQQRIRAVLEFMSGSLRLEGDDVARQWRGLRFEELSGLDKKTVFNYKFVVRILPPDLRDDDIRRVFARINKNVVNLTDQELRNATYWGPFISSIQDMADDDPFWADSGLFSASDHRRMTDHEYISELVVAYLHGPQNKKDRLDHYYRLYEENFEDRDRVVKEMRRVTSEIDRLLPKLTGTRWRKKSDFYTLFLEIAGRQDRLPFDEDSLRTISERINQFGAQVDTLLKLEERDWGAVDENVVVYARNVSRAASDRANRISRAKALSQFVFLERPVHRLPDSHAEGIDTTNLEELAPLESGPHADPDPAPNEWE